MNTVSTGQTIQASHVNQLVNSAQRPSGQSEVGKYYLGFSSYVNNALGSLFVPSISRGATPVSLSLDEADFAHNNCGPIQNDHLTSSGFHAYSFSVGVFSGCNVGGNYTISF